MSLTLSAMRACSTRDPGGAPEENCFSRLQGCNMYGVICCTAGGRIPITDARVPACSAVADLRSKAEHGRSQKQIVWGMSQQSSRTRPIRATITPHQGSRSRPIKAAGHAPSEQQVTPHQSSRSRPIRAAGHGPSEQQVTAHQSSRSHPIRAAGHGPSEQQVKLHQSSRSRPIRAAGHAPSELALAKQSLVRAETPGRRMAGPEAGPPPYMGALLPRVLHCVWPPT